MSILDQHAFDDEDTYIIVSKAKGTDEATIHVHGSLGDVLDLLALAAEAIDEQEPPVRH